MTIDKYVVNRQTTIHGETADIALQVMASDISVHDAETANGAFDQFISVITGKQLSPVKLRHEVPAKWSNEEREAIRCCPSSPESVRVYREKFPKSTRKDSGITRMWLYLKDNKPSCFGRFKEEQGCRDNPCEDTAACRETTHQANEREKAEAPVRSLVAAEEAVTIKKPSTPSKKPAPEKKGSLAKNFDAERWSPDERKVITEAESRQSAIASYREKYPDSKRSDDAIGRQFYEIHPDKRSPDTPWTPEENQPILDADTVEEALAKYRQLFPESARSEAAVRREWYELRPEKRGEIPTGRKKGGANKAPRKGTAREKYQIPFSSKEDKKGYQNAVNLCKNYDKPYEEALKLKKVDQEAKKQKMAKPTHGPEKRPEKIPTVPAKKPDPVPAIPPAAKKTETLVFSSGILTPAVPENKEPTYPATQAFAKDMKVRYTGVHPQFQGSGIVKRINQISGEVLVDIKNGLEWIPGKDLAAA